MTRVAFVSFKGGAGRSVSLANIAFQLALKQGLRVGCLDADIESGGLHTILDVQAPFDQFSADGAHWSGKFPLQVYLMQDVFRRQEFEKYITEDYDPEHSNFVRDYFSIDVREKSLTPPIRDALSNGGGDLLLIPSAPNADFTNKVDTRGDLYAHFFNLLGAFEESCNLETLFVDCRAGISNLSLPALAYVDATVVCIRLGRQHKEGTERFLTWYGRWLQRYESNSKVYILASVMGESERDALLAAEQLLATEAIRGHAKEAFILPFVPELRSNDRVLLTEEYDHYTRQCLEIGKRLCMQDTG